MKREISRIGMLAVFVAIAIIGRGQQLAFPGADGYGKYVSGGRGGEVL